MAQDHLPASNMNGLTPKKKSCSERTDHELPSWTPTFASFTNSDPPSTSHSVSAAAGFNTTMSEWTSTPSTSSTHRGERLGFAGPGLKSLHESKIIKVTFVTGVYGPSFPPIFFLKSKFDHFWPISILMYTQGVSREARDPQHGNVVTAAFITKALDLGVSWFSTTKNTHLATLMIW